MNNYDLNEQAQVLAETHTPHQLAKKFLVAQEEVEYLHGLLVFLDDMLPNLNGLIEEKSTIISMKKKINKNNKENFV